MHRLAYLVILVILNFVTLEKCMLKQILDTLPAGHMAELPQGSAVLPSRT